MALCLHSPCYLNRYLLRNCVLSTSATKRRFTQFTCARSPAARSTEVPRELFEYTSGRWIVNDALRHAERRREFNVPELKRLAAASVNRGSEDVASFKKLAEGGFNRTFLVTMRDGFQMVARIPYTATEPKSLAVASEVATLDYLRLHDLPVPKVYGYSATSENAAGTEYVFMEFVHGTNLGDVWYDLSENARIHAVTKLVELESRAFSLQFPASGSLYYQKDMQALAPSVSGIPLNTADQGTESKFCIGPESTLGLWYGRRLGLQVDRGPYTEPIAALTAGAKKEIEYLKQFGHPIQPLQRLHREAYNYQPQSHLEHIDDLEKYLRVAHHLIPNDNETLLRPTLRHPDLQPNNIFLTEDGEITGLIDWQHCAILPLFLQCGIPNSLQNYGDDVSESLAYPELPGNFDDLSEKEQYEQVLLLRKRQRHYFYLERTENMNPIHSEALTYNKSVLRRKIYTHASAPWEGENITLKADLVDLTKYWQELTGNYSDVPCPITYSDEEAKEIMCLSAEQVEADEAYEACTNLIGCGSEGWVPVDLYEEAKRIEAQLKADSLKSAESEEERARVVEHWMFDDFDESEYL